MLWQLAIIGPSMALCSVARGVAAVNYASYLPSQLKYGRQRRTERLYEETSTATRPCGICHVNGTSFNHDNGTNIPRLSWDRSMLRPAPPFLSNQSDVPSENNWTCADWDAFAAQQYVDSSSQCLDLRDYLTRQCCDGPTLPPLHKCRSAAKDAVLTASYQESLAPVMNQAITVDIIAEIDSFEVEDHGVGGGSISIWGRISFTWEDERLQFFDVMDEMGCASFPVTIADDEIWAPTLGIAEDDTEVERMAFPKSWATVLANGRVHWTGFGRATLPCTTVAGGAKECILRWKDNKDKGFVAYNVPSGVVVHDPLAIPEYRVNEEATKVDVTVNPLYQVDLVLRLDPLRTECNICGYDERTKLIPDIIPDHPKRMVQFANQTCGELDNSLSKLTTSNQNCSLGRSLFEESCCDDERSTFACESSIHDELADLTNTITPPDPSAKEKADFSDFVDVDVFLDVLHVMGIDVKSNTMEMLVGLELQWFDDRLSWDPFLGDCHRASFRASTDAELTEIWVPNIELVNLEEGVNNLPEERASVFSDGRVWWHRRGTLRATCELFGIQEFPFDTTGCYLEFGGIRNPLFHRVRYIEHGVGFAKRVRDESWNFQEYKLDTDKTNITMRKEELSGFSNDIIRYQFYFKRAYGYYVNMFVVLYIIFTLLSFGMFFVDYRIGERLGYGSSILFVIVAQDITMSEFTPVTQEFLWLFKLSLGSKIFVIMGIVQSIIILYIFYGYGDLEAELDNLEANNKSNDETHPFLEAGEWSKNSREETCDNNIEEKTEMSRCPQSKDCNSAIDENEHGLGLAHHQSSKQKSSAPLNAARESRTTNSDIAFEDGAGDDITQKQVTSIKKGLFCAMKAVFKSKAAKNIVGEHLIPKRGDPERIQRIKKLWMIDKITAMCFVLAYSLFLIGMFVSLVD